MEWRVYKQERPDRAGRYLISIMKDRPNGKSAFTYVAHYEVENDSWHYYDPFVEKVGEAIRENVTAWSEGIGVFLE
jgi:hypothetical protein